MDAPFLSPRCSPPWTLQVALLRSDDGMTFLLSLDEDAFLGNLACPAPPVKETIAIAVQLTMAPFLPRTRLG